MKKQIVLLTAIFFAVSMVMVGCKAEVHSHTYSEDWTYNTSGHWHAATCEHTEEKADYAEHSYGEWKIVQAATEEAEGSEERTCNVCLHKETAVIAKLEHTHTYSEDWTYDASGHWHVATCEHTEEKADYAKHSFGEYVSNNDATTEADGTKTRECSVCGYEDTVTDEGSKIHVHTYSEAWTYDPSGHWHAATCEHTEKKADYAEHSFGEYVSNNDATTEADGTKTRECSVCGYEDTETDEGSKIHVHTFATEWTSDASGHWHAATCEHTEEISDYAEHTYGTWKVTTEPTTNAEGKNEKNCSNCGYVYSVVLQPAPEGFRFVKGTTITGTESWTPSSRVFVSGRKLTIPDLIVSDHEVTRGEYKAVMGKDPSIESAYDKEGNKLEGDDVINNPVNSVKWYDAIVYCNKRSMTEGLTPCYSIKGSTDPDDWGEVPTSSNTKWNAATCDFEANGYRLPTEAEWEWLARGGENFEYAGSDTLDEVAWYTDNTNDTGTREVKTKAPNGYGLYDMSGNVYEWCWDWYGGSISSSSTWGDYRVRRGGSWYSLDSSCQVAIRSSDNPSRRYGYYGFRVVRPSSN